jgi:ABC-2 type transport system ATP-binding protein
MALIVNGLSKKYGTQTAVADLTFTIDKGMVVGFLGPNGAGKSTTLKMIAGYLAPDAGEVILNGISNQKDPIAFKKLIGYLPEANPLYEEMYVKEYFSFLSDIHEIKNKEERIQQVIQMLALETMQHKKIGQLSKGYKQRVGIAGAILHEPILLLLDEPTSGLDPNQLIEIRAVIQALSAHAMILFSSHILQEVTAICSKVLVLHQGKLVANESIDQLLKPITNNLHVQFEEDISHCVGMIQALGVEIVSVNKQLLVVKTAEGVDVKKLILQFAMDMGFNIERLHIEQASLEEIFKLLTH